ncbi:MAG: phosphodiester glycosidase family protein [Candidatus Kapaibacterium sp.]
MIIITEIHAEDDGLIADSTLFPGVEYRLMHINNGRYKHKVHVIEANLINPGTSIAVLKAGGLNTYLEHLHIMAEKYDSVSTGRIIGAINANFWSAYRNYPIGCTVIEGEIVEDGRYKNWSSIFFDEVSRPYIDTFELDLRLILPDRSAIKIDDVNRRRDSLQIVLYNKYYGSEIPFISSLEINHALNEAAAEHYLNMADDSTESLLDTASFLRNYKEETVLNRDEYFYKKILLRYLDMPAVNRPYRVVINRIDTGLIEISDNEIIVSMGLSGDLPRLTAGDTLTVIAKTNKMSDIVFKNAVSGTPRLVRDGKADHEAYIEGSRGRRFIMHRLPRTAIGTDKLATKIIIAVVEKGSRSEGVTGASLSELAQIMKKLGCHNAMNLDGGGSSMMFVNGDITTSKSPNNSLRKISVGLSIIKKRGALHDIFPKK